MSDTPKFTVVDRRKFRAEEESAPAQEAKAEPVRRDESRLQSAILDSAKHDSPKPDPARPDSVERESAKPVPVAPAGPRLTLVEPTTRPETSVAVAEEPEPGPESLDDPNLPPAPTAEEMRFHKMAYDQAAERLEILVRSQNPGAPPSEKIGFEHLVQQLYLSAMMQMGAGTPEGQRPRIDILGARQTIDLLSVLEDRTRGKLRADEARMLDTVLLELRLTFVDLTRMISAQPAAPMPPPPTGPKR